jgi:uncharacterized protein YecT (DUF1311 family)
MKYCFCVLIFLTCCLSFSQESPQYRTCNKKAVTQLEMNICANDEAKRVDDELNRVYKLLLSKVADDAVATDKIKAAQRAWIAYRDAYIDAMYPAEDKRVEYGLIFPMEEALLRAKLTRRQTDALRDILKENEPR